MGGGLNPHPIHPPHNHRKNPARKNHQDAAAALPTGTTVPGRTASLRGRRFVVILLSLVVWLVVVSTRMTRQQNRWFLDYTNQQQNANTIHYRVHLDTTAAATTTTITNGIIINNPFSGLPQHLQPTASPTTSLGGIAREVLKYSDSLESMPLWKAAMLWKRIGADSFKTNTTTTSTSFFGQQRPDAALQRLRVEFKTKRAVKNDMSPPPREAKKKKKKPIIAIITSTVSKGKRDLPVVQSLLCEKLLQSLILTISEAERKTWHIHVYVAIDDTDTWWLDHWQQIGRSIGSSNVVLDHDWLNITLAVFPSRKGNIPFNEIALVAYEEGAEYLCRVNDDTEFTTSDWITAAVTALQTRFDPPNVGVVAPRCGQGKVEIMTHDFVHKTHMEIFQGHYYPPVFDNWFLDDWISHVYSKSVLGVDFHRAVFLDDWKVTHWEFTRRYTFKVLDAAFLPFEYERGRQMIHNYISQHYPAHAKSIASSLPKPRRVHETVVNAVLKVLPSQGNLLVWGLDGDSPFWHMATAGSVVFLGPEALPKPVPYVWFDPITFKIASGSSDEMFERYSGQPLKQNNSHWCELPMPLPDSVVETFWDVILVAAPEVCANPFFCDDSDGPGVWEVLYATKSIALAQAERARQANDTDRTTHVFVKNFERKIEAEFSQALFESKPVAVVETVISTNTKKVAHFILDSNQTRSLDVEEYCAPAMQFKSLERLIPWKYPDISEIEDSIVKTNPGKWAILLEVNNGYYEFFLNWLHHFIPLHIAIRVVVMTMDDAVHAKLKMKIMPLFPQLTIQRSNINNTEAAADWGTPDFATMVSSRATHIRELLQNGTNVIYTDVDTVWRSNPLPFLFFSSTGSGPDVILSINSMEHLAFSPYYSTGFMAIVANEKTVTLTQSWEEALKTPQSNAPVFNKILFDSSTAKHQPLSNTEFPNGELYFDKFPHKLRLKAVVVHNDYIAGVKDKQSRFEKHGLWNLTIDDIGSS